MPADDTLHDWIRRQFRVSKRNILRAKDELVLRTHAGDALGSEFRSVVLDEFASLEATMLMIARQLDQAGAQFNEHSLAALSRVEQQLDQISQRLDAAAAADEAAAIAAAADEAAAEVPVEPLAEARH